MSYAYGTIVRSRSTISFYLVHVYESMISKKDIKTFFFLSTHTHSHTHTHTKIKNKKKIKCFSRSYKKEFNFNISFVLVTPLLLAYDQHFCLRFVKTKVFFTKLVRKNSISTSVLFHLCFIQSPCAIYMNDTNFKLKKHL